MTPTNPQFPDDCNREDGYDEDEDELAEDEFDCGIYCNETGVPQGCSMAGSEQCDFGCPHRDWLYAQRTTP